MFQNIKQKLHDVAMRFIWQQIAKLQKINGTTPYLINWKTEHLAQSPEAFKQIA